MVFYKPTMLLSVRELLCMISFCGWHEVTPVEILWVNLDNPKTRFAGLKKYQKIQSSIADNVSSQGG